MTGDGFVIKGEQITESRDFFAPGLEQLSFQQADRRRVIVTQEANDRVLMKHLTFLQFSRARRKEDDQLRSKKTPWDRKWPPHFVGSAGLSPDHWTQQLRLSLLLPFAQRRISAVRTVVAVVATKLVIDRKTFVPLLHPESAHHFGRG